MKRPTMPALLGLAHGVADGAAGLLLGSLHVWMPLKQVGVLVLVYNLLAFAAQPLVGLMTDRLRRPKAALFLGLLLLTSALLFGSVQPTLAVALAGIGSSAFHVGGGALAYGATPGRANGPGVFAAPGVIGLAVGGALAATGHLAPWPVIVGLIGLMVIVGSIRTPKVSYVRHNEPLIEGHDLLMLTLLAAIAMRSLVWTSVQFLLEGRWDALLIVAVAAAAGKGVGGYAADRFGWRRWTVIALLASTPLLVLGGSHMAGLIPGVFLLQSATPGALLATSKLLPGRPSLAAGFALGLAIAVGGLPMAVGLSPPLLPILLGAALLLALTRIRRARVVQV